VAAADAIANESLAHSTSRATSRHDVVVVSDSNEEVTLEHNVESELESKAASIGSENNKSLSVPRENNAACICSENSKASIGHGDATGKTAVLVCDTKSLRCRSQYL
jgi:hypothetical protein